MSLRRFLPVGALQRPRVDVAVPTWAGRGTVGSVAA